MRHQWDMVGRLSGESASHAHFVTGASVRSFTQGSSTLDIRKQQQRSGTDGDARRQTKGPNREEKERSTIKKSDVRGMQKQQH